MNRHEELLFPERLDDYGYLYRLRSSRRLEQETRRNVEPLWLLKKLRPDHKTIANFRCDNLNPMRQVCRAFTLLCKQLPVFSANNPPLHGHEKARKSSPGAVLPAGEGG